VKTEIYKIIILPVVLYGGETWYLTLREEHRLMVSENRVLRRIFGPKRDKFTEWWNKLHNEDLHNFRRLRRRSEGDIKMDLTEIVLEDVDWINLAQDMTLASSCEHSNEPSGPIKSREFLD
jgi:hypothetical protein